MTSIIVPFDKVPNRNEVTILILGAEGLGKHSLGLSVANLAELFTVNCQIITEFPEDNCDMLPRIDFICYVLSQNDRNSFEIIEEAFTEIDTRYFIGRSCLVVCKGKSGSSWTVDPEMVTQLADNFDIPVFYVDMEVSKDREVTASRIVSMIEVAGGFINGVSSLLFDSTRMNFEMAL